MIGINASRRQFFAQVGITIVTLTAIGSTRQANAGQNATMRSALKYQAKPDGEKRCSNCAQFVPGSGPKELGGCKIMPGDTEIAPDAYCTAWVKKA